MLFEDFLFQFIFNSRDIILVLCQNVNLLNLRTAFVQQFTLIIRDKNRITIINGIIVNRISASLNNADNRKLLAVHREHLADRTIGIE